MRFRYVPTAIALAGTLFAHPGYADPTPAAPPPTAPAPPAPADPHATFAGTFRWVGGPSEEAAWRAAIDRSTADTFVVIRGMVRSKLRDMFKIEPDFTFTFEKGTIRAHSLGTDPISPENGAWVDYTMPFGEKAKLSQRFGGPTKLLQIFNGEGKRVNDWTALPDGSTLKLNVTITHPRISSPIVYTLTYKKTR